MAKSDPLVAVLDAATPNRGGVKLLLDSLPADVQQAVIRAHQRKVSNREIARLLTAQGMECSEGAVKNWLARRG